MGVKPLCKIGARLEHGAAACYFELLPPEWRNWQTRWTQNPVVLSTVWFDPLLRIRLIQQSLKNSEMCKL